MAHARIRADAGRSVFAEGAARVTAFTAARAETAVAEGFVKRECLSLYGVFDEPEPLLDYLEGYRAPAPDPRRLKDI